MTDSVVNPSEPGSRTSLSLLERVRRRDPAAWDRLVAVYGPMVYGWCRRAGLQAADAADVGQEVFASVNRAIEGFRHDRNGDTFRGWLFTITRNKLRDRQAPPGTTGVGGSDALRRLTEWPTRQPPEDVVTVNEARALQRRAIEVVRAEFEAHTWDAFRRAFVDGVPATDVAVELGITANAVYLAKSRVLRRLREEFAALLDFGTPR